MSVDREKLLVGGLEIIPVKEALDDAVLDGEGSLTQQVYRLLRSLVVALQLLPNQFLSEKDVAASLNISKTPVREAFIRLAEDGIVRIVPKSGTYVAPIDIERALEGYFIWSALECSCTAQAAEQFTLADIGKLRSSLGRHKAALDAGDAELFDRENDAFHQTIFEIADLPDARKLIDQARFEVDRVLRMRSEKSSQDMAGVLDDHSAIVNAIGRHDPEEARECMATHLSRVHTTIESLVHNEEQLMLLHFLNQKRPGTRRPRAEKNKGAS